MHSNKLGNNSLLGKIGRRIPADTSKLCKQKLVVQFFTEKQKKTNLETFILMQFDCQRFESDQTFLSVKCNYFKFWDFIGQRNVQNAFKH